MSNFRLLLWAMSFCLSAWLPVAYAEQQATDPDAVTGSPEKNEAKSENNGDETLEIERIAKLEKIIKSDKKDLKDLKKSLSGRIKILKLLQNALKMTKVKLDSDTEMLAIAKEMNDATEVASLEKELRVTESDYDLLAGQTQLAFEAEKTVRHQIELIENSIIKKQQTLDEFKGIKKRVVAIPEQTVPAVVAPNANSSRGAPLSPMQLMIPGMSPAAVESGGTGAAPSPTEQLQTAEQVEARKQAEKSTREALEAEQVAVDYIEQNSALIERVKLAEKLLATDMESRANFIRINEILENRLQEGPKKGFDKARLKKIKKNIELVKQEIKKLSKEIEKRKGNIEAAQGEMVSLQEDQELLAEEALKKR
ncbi:MAG TPA: hypothetical protein ENI64_08885, partial [Gammaproteobacteria bacterium]|nr:hypothetical protein [Gammaproteobacteria bacterium]